jgi:hypothetical protein
MCALIEKLSGSLGISAKSHGNLTLIAIEDCGRIIEACESSSILILGIEAFRLEEQFVIPEMDLIADYSGLASMPWEDACLEAARSAESYFSKVKGRTELWFEFYLTQRE